MKLAVVTETYPPDVNGCAKTLGQLVEGMRGKDHFVQLARPRQHAHEHRTCAESMELVPLPGLAIPCYRVQQFGLPAGRYLEKLWESDPPQVVYIATEGPLGYSALSAARRLNLPVISGFHTCFQTSSQHYGLSFLQPIVLRYLRTFHRKRDCTLAPSPALCATLEQTGFGPTRVLSRGIDTERFSPEKRSKRLRQSWGTGEDDPVVIYVGRLAEGKNIRLAFGAFRRISQLQPHARFVVVGDGPARETLEKNNRDCIFTGWQAGEALAQHYASADIFLFPSTTEAFGNVVLEAMASGLCVIAYDYAAARMHIDHKKSGILAPKDNEDIFLEHSLRISEHLGFARLIGEKARQTAEKITWKCVIDRFETIVQYHARRRTTDAKIPARTRS